MNKKQIMVGVIITALVLTMISIGVQYYTQGCILCIEWEVSQAAIVSYIESSGPWAILIYIALYAINTVTLLPPIVILSLSAGVLFSPLWGIIALTAGSFLGSTLTFALTRKFGTKFIGKLDLGKAAKFNDKLGENGFLVLLPIRLLGLPPYEVVNYACGLSKISYLNYITATMLGMQPWIIGQVLLADHLTGFSWNNPAIYIGIIVLIIAGWVLLRISKR